MMNDELRLETSKQLAERVGVSEGAIRTLIRNRQIEYVQIGSRVLIPTGAWERFVTANTVKPCQDVTKVRASVGSKSATASTSPGPSAVAVASAQLAVQTASKLKRSSPRGSRLEDNVSGQVIRMRSS